MKDTSPVIRVRFNGLLGEFKLDVNFDIPMRGVTGLVGPSGSGKTTILRCISGLVRLPGELIVGDQTWQNGTTFLAPHQRPVGYVFQEASLFAHLSVRNNLTFGQQRIRKPASIEEIRLDDVVGLLNLEPLLDRSTTALSGGERQRVSIGRALLSQPRLLLMDEPLSALDIRSKEEILPYFEALHGALSIPILYVSHDMKEVERLADVMILLDRGRVAARGFLGDVLTEASLPIANRPDAGTVVEALAVAFDSEYSLTAFRLDDETLQVPGRVTEAGKTRRVRIAAADVSLARDRPSRTSILNVFPVRVRSIHPIGEGQVNILVTVGHCDGGTKLLARISKRALETLGLVEGQDAYAQVKGVSLIV